MTARNNRERRGGVLGCHAPLHVRMRHNEVNREPDDLGRQVGQALRALPSAERTSSVRFRPSTYPSSRSPCRNSSMALAAEVNIQNPYAVDFHRLLRLGGARRHQAAEGEDQDDPDGATPHGALLQSGYGLPGGHPHTPCHRLPAPPAA